MAKDKKTVLMYVDLIHTIEKLDDKNAGLYFKHFLRYVNDLNPIPPSVLIDVVFEPHKQQLKRDLVKYDDFCNKQKNNGLKGGRPKSQNKPKNPSLFLETQKSLTDTDTDTDTVKDINKTIVLSLIDFSKNFFEEKYIKEKPYISLLKKGYTDIQIKTAIRFGRTDNFWMNNFLSPSKLLTKDKSDVLYIDLFLSKCNQSNSNSILTEERFDFAKIGKGSGEWRGKFYYYNGNFYSNDGKWHHGA